MKLVNKQSITSCTSGVVGDPIQPAQHIRHPRSHDLVWKCKRLWINMEHLKNHPSWGNSCSRSNNILNNGPKNQRSPRNSLISSPHPQWTAWQENTGYFLVAEFTTSLTNSPNASSWERVFCMSGEPVPEHLVELLRRLKRKESRVLENSPSRSGAGWGNYRGRLIQEIDFC